MASKKKQAVKRIKGQCPAEMMLDRIIKDIAAYNSINAKSGGDERTELFLTTVAERKAEAARMMSWGEQYSADIACMAIHEAFQIGEGRQPIFNDVYTRLYKEFADLSYDDGQIDEEREYSTEVFERRLREAVGKNYQPRETRYSVEIKFNGIKMEEKE